MPTTRKTHQRHQSNNEPPRAERGSPVLKRFSRNRDEDSDLETITVAGEEGGPCARGRRGAQETSEATIAVVHLVADLKETIASQSDIIREIRTELTEIKIALQALESRNREPREDLKLLATYQSLSSVIASERTWQISSLPFARSTQLSLGQSLNLWATTKLRKSALLASCP
ncbi:uncharacterized protein Z520_12356 [Fonsecaea multimorphosa CBS 102226]|uniref:Uncharacterized protein n=1 Tax=Fonsecaea multimorphosa CBS 102226 TaxID=1442371 RepID=A0A0D2JFL9_9EURO|nr:uncharacterized protein Z520_12356 [Fonsecaea multimorphosa CBS 102226]KIX91967.1 hypothetical protein Z520_12356 [Fonsecaea multimorphosa CBS 102226]OAL17337.1 hypothetical protein AYO22_11779 [Fonsecaea multimorphosa]